MKIRPETHTDWPAIRELHMKAFDQTNEADLIEILRNEVFFLPEMSLVAEDENQIIGHALFSDIIIEKTNLTILCAALGPIAVAQGHRKKGVATALIREGLNSVKKLGYAGVFVLGDPKLYKEFGFSNRVADQFDSAFKSEHYMGVELFEGALHDFKMGRVIYPTPWASL